MSESPTESPAAQEPMLSAAEPPALDRSQPEAPPAEHRPAVPEPILDLDGLRRAVEDGFVRLARAFDEKLADDTSQERRIAALHRELQEHREGLLERALRPLLAALVRLHDDLGRVADDALGRPADALTPELVGRWLADFQDDVEIVLADHGVTPFREAAPRFDPRRQTARQTLEAADDDLVGLVAHRVRPGFERGDELLQKERVDVYVAPRPLPRAEPSVAPSS